MCPILHYATISLFIWLTGKKSPVPACKIQKSFFIRIRTPDNKPLGYALRFL